MSTSTESGGGDELRIGPDEISEILRTFESSGWSGMHLRVGGVTVTAGKDAPPPETRQAPTVPAPAESGGPPPVPASPAAPVPPAPAAAAPAAAAPPPADDIDETGLAKVTSPTVGSFWVAPDPGSPPFVAVGDRVEAGDQLGIVEVMKLMNPVVTEVAGEVVAVRAANADLVEFGQTLFLLRPDE